MAAMTMIPLRAALLALAMIATPADAQQGPLRIGLSAPLTGPDAAFGLGMRLGAEQAVADLNRAGGAGGRKLQLVVRDDAGDPQQAATVARRFATEGVVLVVGPLSSGTAGAALPVMEEAGLVAVLPGAVWPALTGRGAWNVFRVCGNDAQQGTAAGAWLAERFGDRPVALVHDRSAFGRTLADEAARALKERGGREALFESVARGERDVSALVAKLRATRAAAVYFGGLAPEGAALVRGLREAGLSIPLVGSDGLLDKDFAALAGPGAEGTVMTLSPEPPRLPEGRSQGRGEGRSEGRGTSRRPPPPRPPEAEVFAARAYAAVEVLARGVEGARSAEPRTLAAYLRGGKPMATMLGEIAFDARGDLAQSPYRIQTWQRTADGRIDYAGPPPAP